MTERWRKRLGDIDDATPSEDVFHRAHEGPQMPDEVIPRPSTSSRVVTGIAAFVVFALAISVFAIPALRMNDGPGSPTGLGVMPLWPARSVEDLEALQASVDAGEDQWATDPEQAAVWFAKSVLGWEDVRVFEDVRIPGMNDPGNGLCIPYTGGSGTVCDDINYLGITERNATAVAYACPNEWCPPTVDRSGTPSTGLPTTVPPSPYRRFALYDAMDRMQIATRVELYQPLESGDGQIWAIREVVSDGLQLSASTGQQLADGDLLWASATSEWMGSGSLGYRAGSVPASCDVSAFTSLIDRPQPSTSGTATPAPMADYSGGELTVDLSDPDEGCAQAEPGYAWVATADGGGSVLDPLAGGGQVRLSGLTASAVVFAIENEVNVPTDPTAVDTATATAVPVQTNEPPQTSTSPTSLTTQEALGFSIDLPSDWVVQFLPGVVGMAAGKDPQGAPSIQITVDEQAEPEDDSTYPLAFTDLPRDGNAYLFRGDGRQFRLTLHGSDQGGASTPEEYALFEEIASSITFAPWAEGDVRDGWVQLMPPEETAGWFDRRGATYVVFHEESSVGLEVFGPLPACEEEDLSLEAGGTNVVQACAGSTNTYGPDGAGGLAEYPVIIAHDDSRVVLLPG